MTLQEVGVRCAARMSSPKRPQSNKHVENPLKIRSQSGLFSPFAIKWMKLKPFYFINPLVANQAHVVVMQYMVIHKTEGWCSVFSF